MTPDLKFMDEPFSAECLNQYVEAENFGGQSIKVIWVFRNNGLTAWQGWPKQVKIEQIRGDKLSFETEDTELNIDDVNIEFTIFMNVVVPRNPGKYEAVFRLCYGEDEIEFGDEV